MKIKYPATLFLGLCGLAIAAVLIYSSFDMNLNGEQKDCYDRYSNKIVGETCIVEGNFDTREVTVIIMSVIGLLIIILLVMFGTLMDEISRGYDTL